MLSFGKGKATLFSDENARQNIERDSKIRRNTQIMNFGRFYAPIPVGRGVQPNQFSPLRYHLPLGASPIVDSRDVQELRPAPKFGKFTSLQGKLYLTPAYCQYLAPTGALYIINFYSAHCCNWYHSLCLSWGYLGNYLGMILSGFI